MIFTLMLIGAGIWFIIPFPWLMAKRPDLRSHLAGLRSPNPAMVNAWKRLLDYGLDWHDYKNLWVEWSRLNIQRSIKARMLIQGVILLAWACDRIL